MSYDESLARLEAIVKELESSDAISMETYKAKALEAKSLLDSCRAQLSSLEGELDKIMPED